MNITEKIDKYLDEKKIKYPKLFGMNLNWKKSKQKGYYVVEIPTKSDYTLEVEWSPEEPDIINWAEKKGKKYGESGSDDISDFTKEWKKEIKKG